MTDEVWKRLNVDVTVEVAGAAAATASEAF